MWRKAPDTGATAPTGRGHCLRGLFIVATTLRKHYTSRTYVELPHGVEIMTPLILQPWKRRTALADATRILAKDRRSESVIRRLKK